MDQYRNIQNRIQTGTGLIEEMKSQPPILFSQLKRSTLPESQGIYWVLDRKKETVLLAEKATNLRKRIYDNQYQSLMPTSKIKKKLFLDNALPDVRTNKDAKEWMETHLQIQYIQYGENIDARELEWNVQLIAGLMQPKYNGS